MNRPVRPVSVANDRWLRPGQSVVIPQARAAASLEPSTKRRHPKTFVEQILYHNQGSFFTGYDSAQEDIELGGHMGYHFCFASDESETIHAASGQSARLDFDR